MAKKLEPPLKSAPKDDWVAYAIAQGVPSYEAWAMTVDELHEKFAPPPVLKSPAAKKAAAAAKVKES